MKVNLWLTWIFGWMIPFVIKYANYMLQESGIIVSMVKRQMVVMGPRFSFSVATLRFLFGDTKTATTTFLSFSLQLVFGAWYIDDLPLPYIESILPKHPKHWALGMFMSSMLEIIGPLIIRELVSLAMDRVNRFRGPPSETNPAAE
jgi:hypothetical protein